MLIGLMRSSASFAGPTLSLLNIAMAEVTRLFLRERREDHRPFTHVTHRLTTPVAKNYEFIKDFLHGLLA